MVWDQIDAGNKHVMNNNNAIIVAVTAMVIFVGSMRSALWIPKGNFALT